MYVHFALCILVPDNDGDGYKEEDCATGECAFLC